MAEPSHGAWEEEVINACIYTDLIADEIEACIFTDLITDELIVIPMIWHHLNKNIGQ